MVEIRHDTVVAFVADLFREAAFMPLACAREECDHPGCHGSQYFPAERQLGQGASCAPLMLCETCWDVLTSDVLPANCTCTGLEEACCPRCWPFMTMRADGSLSREAWDKSVTAARKEHETRAQELYEEYGVWVGE